MIRGAAAVVGIGQLPWFKRGGAPLTDLQMAVRCVVVAAHDAGIDPKEIDGFVSWGNEQSSGANMISALGTRELKFNALVWSHGGGSAGAIGLASQAIATGQAETVVVVRSIAERSGARLSNSVYEGAKPPHEWINGLTLPTHILALGASRAMEKDGLSRQSVMNFVRACYYHANRNPDAYAHGKELSEQEYEQSPYPVEPLHLFDNSRENDCAIALILVSADRAKDLRDDPAFVLSAPMGRFGGMEFSATQTEQGRPTMGFRSVAQRCWQESGYGPKDVDVAQIYTNASTAAIVGIIDHGFCNWDNVNEFMLFENIIAPHGGLPMNTAGGDIADGFIHGAGNNIEAVRQIRGTSTNQVPGARLSLATGGPGDAVVSTVLFGTEETL